MRISKLRRPTHSKKVQSLISRFVRGNRLGIKKHRLVGKQYLDVGCGYFVHDSFINLDYNWHPELDICWDVTKGIPLPDSSLKGIYTEHCLEHLSFEDAYDVLVEFKRLLLPGGAVRIIVPDGELYVDIYVSSKDNLSSNSFPYQYVDPVNGLYSPMMSLNRIMRMWDHRFIYDYQTLHMMLDHHGFVDIKRESFRSGRDSNLLNDRESHSGESLYVEATKPGEST